MRESELTNKIIKRLRELPGVWCTKIHGAAFQRRGLPDILGAVNGRMFALEVKMPGGRLTPLQQAVLSEMERAGIATCVAQSIRDAEEAVARVQDVTEFDLLG